ncbi:trypsin-like peptidase domain-containing protein [Fulvivirgaceae bacterium PWU4]|uniref:Trypsin-like peptidase domain-containing protein n=1 Tax=Chryseosolibacter histidini TaxID=2782349 RepID=A0AAP2DQ38_9BACT|nr:trypsin-like peptidase domain-containing protein [Chryseosolibacter histidini]MBT1699167.1 trypsin-like peptidase domain-containing protein [Chryseosolibacter histidini]
MKRSLFIFLVLVIVACLGGVLGSIFTIRYLDIESAPYNSIDERQQLVLASNTVDTAYKIPEGLDFLDAAKMVTAAVVHIRTGYGPGNFSLNPLLDYDRPIHSSGSGVIISDDGYIVTNNHVIEDATNIEVVMNNNQRFYAKLVGTDLTTDLALLKIKAKDLPFVKYGNSDNVQPGEWVLAIGNPFDLNSTVTAGIVSAKARNIGILREKNNYQVEAFIQTDAAVNPGNSGGALVNLRGELIGINTAIATSSGSYQGYSFAIPVALVRKVMDDLLEYGEVQRGLLGIGIGDVNASIAETLHLTVSQGVLVSTVNPGSAAEQSGILRGDVIIEIDNHIVNSVSELQEWVARNRPGKEIQVTFIREGEKRTVKARLKNSNGNEVMEKKEVSYSIDGATFENVPYRELAKLLLEGGVKVKDVDDGKWKKAGLRRGFVIGYIDKVPVDNVEDLNRILDYKKGGILIEGYYSDGKKGTYGVDW